MLKECTSDHWLMLCISTSHGHVIHEVIIVLILEIFSHFSIYRLSKELFHGIVANLCNTEHQSCHEPETCSGGHIVFKKMLDLCKMSKTFLFI